MILNSGKTCTPSMLSADVDEEDDVDLADAMEHDRAPSQSDKDPVVPVCCEVDEKRESGLGMLPEGSDLTARMMSFVIVASVNSTSPSIRSSSKLISRIANATSNGISRVTSTDILLLSSIVEQVYTTMLDLILSAKPLHVLS